MGRRVAIYDAILVSDSYIGPKKMVNFDMYNAYFILTAVRTRRHLYSGFKIGIKVYLKSTLAYFEFILDITQMSRHFARDQ